MPNAHKLPNAGYLAINFRRVKDPGDAGTFTFHSKDSAYSEVVTEGAETRVLPAAGGYRVTTRFRVILVTDGGDLTITGAEASVVLQDANDTVEFVVTRSGSTKAWRLDSDSRARVARSVQLPLNEFRIHDDFDTFLPETAAVDDLGFIEGAFGTSAPSLRAITATGLTDSSYGRIQWPVPADYVAGTNITVTVVATEADAAAVSTLLDLAAFRLAAPTSDKQATAPTTIVGGATVVFTITGTDIVNGDILDLRLKVTNNDTAGDGTDHNLTSVTVAYTGAKN